MSDAVAPPWVKLTEDTAAHFQGATIEARRHGGEVERHETGVIFTSMAMRWLQTGEVGLHAWSNGLAIDGAWEIRQVGPALHSDSLAFAGALG